MRLVPSSWLVGGVSVRLTNGGKQFRLLLLPTPPTGVRGGGAACGV